MGHYDDFYEQEAEKRRAWKLKELEKLKKEFPKEYKLFLKHQAMKSAYNIFKHTL